MVWYYAPGYFAEAGGDPTLMRQITGLNIVPEGRFLEGGTALFTDPEGGGTQTLELLRGESFVVDDPPATALAVRSDDAGQMVMAKKRFLDGTSVDPSHKSMNMGWTVITGMVIYGGPIVSIRNTPSIPCKRIGRKIFTGP